MIDVNTLVTGRAVVWHKPGKRYAVSATVVMIDKRAEMVQVLEQNGRFGYAKAADLEPVKVKKANHG